MAESIIPAVIMGHDGLPLKPILIGTKRAVISIGRAARRVGVHRSTVRNWITRGVKLADGTVLKLPAEDNLFYNGRQTIDRAVFNHFCAALLHARQNKMTLQQVKSGRPKRTAGAI